MGRGSNRGIVCSVYARGQRLKDLKTSKKLDELLDTFDSVIYVTRIATGSTTVFVDVPACNPSFGQSYAHLHVRPRVVYCEES